MLPDFGENVRRPTELATDALLQEHVDLEATAAPDPTADGAADRAPDAGPGGPVPTARGSATGAAPDAAAPDRPPAAPPPAVPPPPPAVVPPAAEGASGSEGGRWGIVVPILLAGLGLVAAVIAWRIGLAGSAADDANRAGLDAARERAATVIIDEGLTSRATEAYLDFERDIRRAEALAAAGDNDQAQLNWMAAVGHWFLVRPEYIDRTGQFQPAQERAALLADAESRADIQPLAHFSAADAEYERLRGLIGAGVIVALALPFLTLAEIGRGRLRIASLIAGVGIFGAGIALALTAWM